MLQMLVYLSFRKKAPSSPVPPFAFAEDVLLEPAKERISAYAHQLADFSSSIRVTIYFHWRIYPPQE